MKKIRFLLALAIVALLGISWGKYLYGKERTMSQYSKNITQADNYMKQKLYDRAIQKYTKAIEYKSTEKNWEKLLKAYQLRSEETDIYGKEAADDYIVQLDKAIHTIEPNEDMILELTDSYVKEEEYEEAQNTLKYAESKGIKSKALEEKKEEIRYIYTLNSTKITSFSSYSNDSYAVNNGSYWGIIDSDGELDHEFEYSYLSQSGEDQVRIITKGEDSRLYDKEDKVLGIFDFTVSDAGTYAENKIAVKNGEFYSYYNALAQKQFGEFEQAGTFTEGLAAVKKDGKWGIIDEKGKIKEEYAYDEIVLDNQGHYCNNGIILAKHNGKYSIYNEKFKKIGKFECEEIGVPTEDKLYAFMKNGKWGFVDSEGKEIISPEYDGAKSFSNGLAAVCKDGKWGFITKNNKLVIDYEFTDADYFNENGICIVQCQDPYEESGYTWKVLKLELGLEK